MRPDLSGLTGSSFDVVIIGGGINGASAAQHLAASGYDVLLVDKNDFGSGSTSRSSRLLHCGLRYLAPGRSMMDFARHPSRLATALRMAREAMEARAEFVQTTSVRATPMRFCFPIYRGGPYRGWQVDLAFRILQWLGPGSVPLSYERWRPAVARERPLVRHLRDFDEIESIATFREYQLDWPERICVDTVLDAERLGGIVRNYTKAKLVRHDPAAGWTIELLDMIHRDRTATVRAKVVLNLAGIWIDEVNRAAAPQARRRVLGTKGSHILVRLPPDCAGIGIATLNRKGDPFYCVPWRGLHYFGPTETLFDGDADEVAVTEAEAAWLIEEANHLLPSLSLGQQDIVSTWAGVRPLTYHPESPAGLRSREIHDLAADRLPNVLALTAGPVMTYRSAGRALAQQVAARLQPRRPAQRPSYEPHAPAGNRDSQTLLPGAQEPKLSDLRHAVVAEHATSLSDILYRRVGVAWSRHLTDEELDRAVGAIADALGWTQERRLAEIRRYHSDVEKLHAPRERAPAGFA